MEKRRQEEFRLRKWSRGVKGCIFQMELMKKQPIIIYDEMIDFAKYAFNKSHGSLCGAGFLPDRISEILLSKGFMAALNVFGLDNVSKFSGIYPDLPSYDGYRHSAAGYQRRRKWVLCIRRTAYATAFLRSKGGKTGCGCHPGRTEEKWVSQLYMEDFINRMTNKGVKPPYH